MIRNFKTYFKNNKLFKYIDVFQLSVVVSICEKFKAFIA